MATKDATRREDVTVTRTQEVKGNRNAGGNGRNSIEPSGLTSFSILGVRVHLVSPEDALSVLEYLINDGGSHHVATVNPEFIMKAQRDPVFRDVLNATSLSVPDGIGVVIAARLAGARKVERVTGVDTVERMAALSATRGYRFYLLGSAPGVAERAGAVLRNRYPGLTIAGAFSGSPRPEEEKDIVSRVRAVHPDILFVAYGTPAQEMWISRNLTALNVPVCIGVGGTFDFIAGEVPRAPAWMQRIGAEWVYRLVIQPTRWRRMLDLPRFAVRVVRDRMQRGQT